MTQVFWSFNGFYHGRKFVHFWDALDYAKCMGRAARLDVNGKPKATWTPKEGFKYL